jgi:hypothetical protein
MGAIALADRAGSLPAERLMSTLKKSVYTKAVGERAAMAPAPFEEVFEGACL